MILTKVEYLLVCTAIVKCTINVWEYADICGLTHFGINTFSVRRACRINLSQRLRGNFGGILLNPVMMRSLNV